MKVFSGTSNLPLAQKVADMLHTPLSPLDIYIFPDGEKRVRVNSGVVGEHAVVIQPTNTPVDSNTMELFFIVDALKRSGAEFVTAVVPYLGYQRQHHVFEDGEAVSLEVIGETLKSVGLDNIISLDLHSSRTPDIFPIPLTHLSALPLFAATIKQLSKFSLSSLGEGRGEVGSQRPNTSGVRELSDTVLVSPDTGGIRRIKLISEMLNNMPYVVVDKNRDLQSGHVSATEFEEGSLEGKKHALIVDDIIASGQTIAVTCNLLAKHGITTVDVFATHAIFSEDAPQILQQSGAGKIYVTDSVSIPKEKHFPKLEVLSI